MPLQTFMLRVITSRAQTESSAGICVLFSHESLKRPSAAHISVSAACLGLSMKYWLYV